MTLGSGSNEGVLFVIGASAGGMNALGYIFSQLEECFPLPILVTKHVGSGDDEGMLKVLSWQSRLRINLAKDKQEIVPGEIYLAPSGYHMLVEERGVISLNIEAPVAHVRPAIDVLFQSAARVYQQSLVAIVLTGANTDGSDGIRSVKAHGGTTVAQCPGSAEMGVMPRASLETGCVDHLVKLDEIPAFLNACAWQGRVKKTANRDGGDG
ncbi:MAG: chemotaxis protein CheB [Endozoicomonas sp.]